MLEARLGVDPGHDLILIPLSVFKNVVFFTMIPLTSVSFWYLPRLPILPSIKMSIQIQS